MEQNGKTTAIVSYITLIGWFIAFFAMHKDNRTSLGSYHLRQTLLLYICALVYQVLMRVLVHILPLPVMSVLSILSLGFLILWIWGLVAAINGEEKPIPLIGERAQTMFSNI